MSKEKAAGDAHADPFKMAFGQRLRSVRDAKSPPLTQEGLGSQVAVKKANVSQWENGTHTPKLETLAALCDALGCSADYLLGRAFQGYSAEALQEARAYDALSPEDQRKWRAMRLTMFATA